MLRLLPDAAADEKATRQAGECSAPSRLALRNQDVVMLDLARKRSEAASVGQPFRNLRGLDPIQDPQVVTSTTMSRRIYAPPPPAPKVARSSSSCSNCSGIASAAPVPAA